MGSNPTAAVLKRTEETQREDRASTVEAEAGGMHLRVKDCHGSVGTHQKLKKAWVVFSLETPETPGFWKSASRTDRYLRSAVLSHLVCGNLLWRSSGQRPPGTEEPR